MGVACLLPLGDAHANFSLQKPNNVAGPYSPYFPKGQSGYHITGRPTTTAASGTGGGAVNVAKSGTAVITRPSLPDIRVPVTVTTRVSGAAAAAAAARAASVARALGGPVGAAFVGWEIYKEIKDSGVTICPPPDFFCKPTEVNYDRDQIGWKMATGGDGVWSINGYIAALIAGFTFNDKYVLHDITPSISSGQPRVDIRFKKEKDGTLMKTVYGLVWRSGEVNKTEKPGPPLTEPELGQHMGDYVGADSSGTRAKKSYDGAMDADVQMRNMGQQGVPQTSMQPSGSASNLTSPPVTTPEETVGTKTGTDAQGNPQTTTTTATTTVTPTVTGTGHETSVTYNITYNTTNVTQGPPNTPPVVIKETVIVRIEPSPQEEPEIPTDYNREVTQKSILELLREAFGPINETAPTGDTEVASIKAENDKALAQATGISAESMGISNWFPTVPTAACIDPQVPVPLTGEMVSVPICDTVNLFSRIISGILCFFCILGCVAQVQSAQKA